MLNLSRLTGVKMSDIMSHMKTLSVREAQHGFAAMLDLVSGGQEVEITRHRRVVARVVPVARETGRAEWPDVMARLKRDFGRKVTPDSAPLFDDMRGKN